MKNSKHIVAVIGGAVSGSEAALQLSRRGIHAVVFDQQALPYGKIEDGLPKWHVGLRDKEIKKIDEKLNHPLVWYVPKTRLGKEIAFSDITDNMKFSAVFLAGGAWRDRPLPIENIDNYVGKGLCYQNPFMFWYNHYHEKNYSGPSFEIPDDVAIIGGGLASLDVAKAVMMVLVEQKLRERGIVAHMFDLEKGIEKFLEKQGLTFSELNIKGCTLYYRRRDVDMPLTPALIDTPEKLLKAQATRAKILNNFQTKYLFRFVGNCAPVDKIEENGRLSGIVFQKNKIENDKLIPMQGDYLRATSKLVISSIGSLPEQIPGVPFANDTYKVSNKQTCQLDGYEKVFVVGNALTGRGNIKESQEHADFLTNSTIENYLEWDENHFRELIQLKEIQITARISGMIDSLSQSKILIESEFDKLTRQVLNLQKAAGYDGDYFKWISRHIPERLEKILLRK